MGLLREETLMTQNQALLPQILIKKGNLVWQNILAVATGVAILSLLAQISIHLPFTPVPITGQTFGVALTALLWGRKRGVATVMTYLALGGMGLPIFAFGQAGLMGPTLGYLAGMLVAAFVMGSLADLGWTKTFLKTWFAGICGSVCVFSLGLIGLSFFIPRGELLVAGLWPFLAGDLIKTLVASAIAWQSSQRLQAK